MNRTTSAAGVAGLLALVAVLTEGCAPMGARNPQFTAATAPTPVMHLDPAICLAPGTAPDGSAVRHARQIETRLHAEMPVQAVPLAPDARAFVCERLASDKAFFQYDIIGRDWTLRPIPRVFINQLATRNGAATMLVPIVRSPPCWFPALGARRICSEERDSIYVGVFLVSADGIVLYEAETEIGASADAAKVDAVMDKVLAGVPATYTAARPDVAPFTLEVAQPASPAPP